MTKLKLNSSGNISEQTLLAAYVVAFGNIPFIEQKDEAIIIKDSSHYMNLLFQDNIFITQSELSDKNENQEPLKRFLMLLGGGELIFEKENQVITNEKIKKYEDNEKFIDDFLKFLKDFLRLPLDDKQYLSEIEWTEQLQNEYVYIVSKTDKWFYGSIPLEHISEFLLYKYNLENFLLYCVANKIEGQKDPIKNVIDNLENYYADYKCYLSRYPSEVSDTMKKGLNNVKKL